MGQPSWGSCREAVTAALDKLNTFVTELSSIEDRDLHMDMLIEIAERFSDVPAEIAQRPFEESHRVPGCESEAFVFAKKEDEKMQFYFAVENPHGISAKALAVIIDENLSNLNPSDIQNVSEDIVSQIFGGTISMAKGHGLMNMIAMAKHLAKHA